MHIRSQKDFFAGLVYLLIGGGFAIGALDYEIGEAASMGPGYFPLLGGLVLAFLGAVTCFKALVVKTPDGDPIGPWAWRPLCFIILANFLFGILLGGIPALGIPGMGFIVSVVVLTIVAALAGLQFKLQEALILAAILAGSSWLIFIWGLNLPLQLWPGFISG